MTVSSPVGAHSSAWKRRRRRRLLLWTTVALSMLLGEHGAGNAAPLPDEPAARAVREDVPYPAGMRSLPVSNREELTGQCRARNPRPAVACGLRRIVIPSAMDDQRAAVGIEQGGVTLAQPHVG